MSRPTTTDDGWWLTVLWVVDDDGVVSLRDLAPAAGPPPDPPLARLGPALAGSLSGMILEDAGRLSIRVATVVPADDPGRPWRVPAADPRRVPLGAGSGGDPRYERAGRHGPGGLPPVDRGPEPPVGYAPPAVQDMFDEFMDELRRRQAGELPGGPSFRRRSRQPRRSRRRRQRGVAAGTAETATTATATATVTPIAIGTGPPTARAGAAGSRRDRSGGNAATARACAARSGRSSSCPRRLLRHRHARRRDRPVDRRDLVRERRLRRRLLAAPLGPGRAVRGRRCRSCSRSCSANLWLAGRLLPPADGDGGTLRMLIDRLNEAAERTQQARGAPWEQTGQRQRTGGGHRRHARPPCPTRRHSAGGSSGSSRSSSRSRSAARSPGTGRRSSSG